MFFGIKVEPKKWTPFVPPPEEQLRLHVTQVRLPLTRPSRRLEPPPPTQRRQSIEVLIGGATRITAAPSRPCLVTLASHPSHSLASDAPCSSPSSVHLPFLLATAPHVSPLAPICMNLHRLDRCW